MKTRTSFVSNSSTTSFICLGFTSNNYKELQKKYGGDFECRYLEGERDKYLVGKRWDFEDVCGIDSLSLEELRLHAANIAKKYNVNIEDIKLYFGTVAS
jgi:hypothetical protein